MKICFIINPVAGKGKSREIIPNIQKLCLDLHLDFTIVLSSKKGDATKLASKAVEEGFTKIVAVGGDGTVNEVVNGIAGSTVALGIIPCGSGNNFIRSITNHTDAIKSIIDIIHGDIRKVDLGLCNNRYFINIGSVGIDAEVAIQKEKFKKFFSGSLAYIVSALYTIFTYKGWNMEIEIDEKTFKMKTLLTAIANGRYYGGGIQPAPEAKIDDGYLDICHIKHMSKLKMLLVFPKYMKGKHSNLQEVTLIKGKKVKISNDTPFAINLDGEILVDRVAEFILINDGVNVIFPRDSHIES